MVMNTRMKVNLPQGSGVVQVFPVFPSFAVPHTTWDPFG